MVRVFSPWAVPGLGGRLGRRARGEFWGLARIVCRPITLSAIVCPRCHSSGPCPVQRQPAALVRAAYRTVDLHEALVAQQLGGRGGVLDKGV